MTNHFGSVSQTLQGVPQNQRPQKLIQTIADQLLNASEQETKQYGTELEQAMPQILKVWQQS